MKGISRFLAVLALAAGTVNAAATIDELDAWQISQEAIPNRWSRTCVFTAADGTSTGELVAGTAFKRARVQLPIAG